MKKAKIFSILAICAAFSGNSSAVTVDTSNPYSKVVTCNFYDTFDNCKAYVHPDLSNALTRALWKDGWLDFKPGNIVAAYANYTYLGDFPITLVRALSIDNRGNPYAGGYKSQGNVEFIAGGLFIKITTTEFNTRRQVSVCINNDCDDRTY